MLSNPSAKALSALEEKGQLRRLKCAAGLDLSSNDYLGLSQHPALRETAIRALQDGLVIGSGGSRLLRGHHAAHAELEEKAAAFFDSQKALYFSTGFQANTALFTTLPQRQDVILFDSLIHASARDGIQASHARSIKIPHNNLNAFEDALRRFRNSATHLYIAVEALYSMDGDFAPLPALQALAQHYDATLIIDEAHSTGIYGARGRGLSEDLPQERLITLHTCGKALGVAGGLICTHASTIDLLINRARAFIYSTAPMPLQALLVSKALELVESEAWRREKLFALRDTAAKLLPEYATQSQIFPILIGEEQQTLAIAEALQAKGFDIRAIRPPTVPEGTSRLRLSLNSALDEKILSDFASALRPLLTRKAA
jgi:8-amino-7-oxononanoate synthase